MATGGSILEINCKHPTLGSITFEPFADEDGTLDPGGIRSNDDNKMIGGSGTMVDTMTMTRWSLEVAVINDMDRLDFENAVALAASPIQGDWTFTHINGKVYAGKGKPVGDMTASTKDSKFTLKIAGGGKLAQI